MKHSRIKKVKPPGIGQIRKCNHAQVVAMQCMVCMLSPRDSRNQSGLPCNVLADSLRHRFARSLARFWYPAKEQLANNRGKRKRMVPLNIDQHKIYLDNSPFLVFAYVLLTLYKVKKYCYTYSTSKFISRKSKKFTICNIKVRAKSRNILASMKCSEMEQQGVQYYYTELYDIVNVL